MSFYGNYCHIYRVMFRFLCNFACTAPAVFRQGDESNVSQPKKTKGTRKLQKKIIQGDGCKVQDAGDRVQVLRHRLYGARCTLQGAVCRVPGAWCVVHVVGCRMQNVGCRLRGAGCWLHDKISTRG